MRSKASFRKLQEIVIPKLFVVLSLAIASLMSSIQMVVK